MVVKPFKQSSNIRKTYNNQFFENLKNRTFQTFIISQKHFLLFFPILREIVQIDSWQFLKFSYFWICGFPIVWGHTQGVIRTIHYSKTELGKHVNFKYMKLFTLRDTADTMGLIATTATVNVFLSALCLSSRNTRRNRITQCSQI